MKKGGGSTAFRKEGPSIKHLHKNHRCCKCRKGEKMKTNLEQFLAEEFGISEDLVTQMKKVEEQLEKEFLHYDEIRDYNQYKVLRAMQKCRLSDVHFNWTTGYGYDDIGREKVEEIFATVFGAQDALVRPNIVNGTHALTLCLQALLYPGDEMLSISSKPYDTLDKVIGISEDVQSLKSYGVKYKQVDLLDNGDFDKEGIKREILASSSLKMIYIQRSKGYSSRKSLTVKDIGGIISFIRGFEKDAVIMVDNCYGEFLDTKEPTEVGADIMAGSLIKNPGGGLALTGGYVCGRKDLIELVAKRLTSPGIGKECGLTFGMSRTILQGLFFAPSVVNGAVKGAMFCSKLFEESGYRTFPLWSEERSDIIQAVRLSSPEEIIAFCKGVQEAAPVDSFVSPEPWAMPGYQDPVIMAAGSFIQGSSIELSADAPIREPYTVYFQGGLTYAYSKMGSLLALRNILRLKRS